MSKMPMRVRMAPKGTPMMVAISFHVLRDGDGDERCCIMAFMASIYGAAWTKCNGVVIV